MTPNCPVERAGEPSGPAVVAGIALTVATVTRWLRPLNEGVDDDSDHDTIRRFHAIPGTLFHS